MTDAEIELSRKLLNTQAMLLAMQTKMIKLMLRLEKVEGVVSAMCVDKPASDSLASESRVHP